MGGGGGAPAPNVIQAGAPPVNINPFVPQTNAPYQPGTVGQGNATTKDWSGVMNAPQGAPRALPNTQSFPAAPLLTGGAGMPGLTAADFQAALARMFAPQRPAAPAAPAPVEQAHEGREGPEPAEHAQDGESEHGSAESRQ